MSTSISPLNKGNIVTYKNSRNNDNSDKNSGNDSGGNINSLNKGYSAKITYTQNESGILVNHGTTTSYIYAT